MGAPAPLESQISEKGFHARWSVLEINRNFGQSWYDSFVNEDLQAQAAFAASGVGATF
jgi:inner membrane protein involved in colicin E2 resistance